MKKYKGVAVGFIAGIILSSGALMTYGNSIPIAAFEDNRIGYIFNDGDRILPEGDFKTIVYNDRTYVPVKFIADNLGGKAIWDHEGKNVIVNIPEKIVEVEKIIEIEKIIEVPSENVYRKLPQSYLAREFRLDITNFDRNERGMGSRFNVNIEVTGENPWQVQLYDTEFISADGRIYRVDRSIPLSELDAQLFNDIRKDKNVGGFLTVESIPADINQGRLKIKVIKNTGDREVVNIEIPIEF